MAQAATGINIGPWDQSGLRRLGRPEAGSDLDPQLWPDRDDGIIGPRTDLYSLGVVLDEMLTKNNQFKGESAFVSMRDHTGRSVRPLRARRPDVPEELERLVLVHVSR
jgi:serine/threonine protein kinase